ncbi:MAG: polysaccharide deacetylase family protein [Deltaproteobacteria bacterium]
MQHGPRGAKRIALTFDACSGPPPGKLDLAVLAVLDREQAKATVFAGGRWAEQDPGRVLRLRSDPLIEIESHAYRHPHLPTLSEVALHQELERALDALVRLGAPRPRYLRAPYVEVDGRVLRAARALGLEVVSGELPSGDPDPHFTKARLTRWVLSQAKPGAIVIFHINGRGWHTAEALPAIIAGLRARGFELVTLRELLGG